MFAVVRYGAKQYKVQKDDVLKLERVEGDEGAVVVLEDVLAAGDASGLKTGKVKVAVEIIGQGKDDKKIIFKKRRRQNYRRTRGHRQQVTWVKVQDIGENVQAKAAPAEKKQKKAEAAAPAKKAEAKAAPAKKTTAAKKPAAKKNS